MKVLAAAVLAALAVPALARAEVTMVVRDVPLHGARALAASTPRFDMVGLHWQGSGSVAFRTRSASGRWSAWQPAAPEADDLPDAGSPEARASAGWRLGNPYWTGTSTAIRYRLRGDVRRLRAYFLWSPVDKIPMRALSIAGSPTIITRQAWGADESIRRKPAPDYAPSIQLAIVHHTAGTNSYSRAQSAAIVRGIERYHVLGNGWDDIGYNFLVDKYGQVFEGRWGGITKNVIGAHALGFNDGTVGVAVLGDYDSAPVSGAAVTSLTQLLAWRLDVAHVDPLSTLTYISKGNPRFAAGVPVFMRAVSGHRDTNFTSCPGSRLYALLPAIAQSVGATGLPKLYAPQTSGSIGHPVRITAELSTALPWTVTIANANGTTVASGSGSGTAVDWTWDATNAPPGRYTYAVAAPGVRTATGPVGPVLPKLRILRAGAHPAVVQGASTVFRYELTAPATVTARLLDSTGKTLATLLTASQRAGKRAVNVAAAALSEGRYRVALDAASVDGQQTSASFPLAVDRTLGGFSASAAAFSPRRGETLSFSFVLNLRPAHVVLRIRKARSVVVTVANADYQPGSQTVTWNGRTARGKLVRAGVYSGVLTATTSISTFSRALALRVR